MKESGLEHKAVRREASELPPEPCLRPFFGPVVILRSGTEVVNVLPGKLFENVLLKKVGFFLKGR
jgi:hypothetical protein